MKKFETVAIVQILYSVKNKRVKIFYFEEGEKMPAIGYLKYEDRVFYVNLDNGDRLQITKNLGLIDIYQIECGGKVVYTAPGQMEIISSSRHH